MLLFQKKHSAPPVRKRGHKMSVTIQTAPRLGLDSIFSHASDLQHLHIEEKVHKTFKSQIELKHNQTKHIYKKHINTKYKPQHRKCNNKQLYRHIGQQVDFLYVYVKQTLDEILGSEECTETERTDRRELKTLLEINCSIRKCCFHSG